MTEQGITAGKRDCSTANVQVIAHNAVSRSDSQAKSGNCYTLLKLTLTLVCLELSEVRVTKDEGTRTGNTAGKETGNDGICECRDTEAKAVFRKQGVKKGL